MSFIYLVNAHTFYEGHKTICAFFDKKQAEALVNKCHLLDASKPACPSIEDDDDFWQKFEKENTTFKRKHPAGDSYDSYEVERIKLK